MKILCKSATQVPGRGIVEKGQIIDWQNGVSFPPQVLGNFVEADSEMRLANVEPPKPRESDQPPKGEQPGEAGPTRPPTPEEAAAEQKRAEQVAKDELVKRTAAPVVPGGSSPRKTFASAVMPQRAATKRTREVSAVSMFMAVNPPVR